MAQAFGDERDPEGPFEDYLHEQEADERVVLVGFVGEQPAGYLNVLWRSFYPPFRSAGIPEITDLSVLPAYRRQGIASRLLDEAERIIRTRSQVAGLGVGLAADYGPAQRLYAARGYRPDGRGAWHLDHYVEVGETLTVDDAIAIYLTRELT